MIINATSHTIRNIWIIFLFIIIVVLAFIGTLMQGISIDNLSLPNIKMRQLYIKLDKKLIVNLQDLDIGKDMQASNSLEETAFFIKNFPLLNQFFSEIAIEKITYNNEEIKIFFKDTIFYLDSKLLSINLKITPIDKFKIDIDIQEAHFKDLFLHLNGTMGVDFKNQRYHFDGDFETFGIKGVCLVDLKQNLLTYHLQTENFTNVELTHLMDFIVTQVELDPLAKDWIDKNIIAQSYQINFFEGKLDLGNFDYFPLEMKGGATIKDALVSFEPSVPPAHVDEIGLSFENDSLSFDIHNAIYENKPVQKAIVYIYNLIDKGTGIVVDLDVVSRLDKDIHKILHAFKIDVPITQLSGETKAKVKLDIKFLPYDINATGQFSTSKSDFKLNDIVMYTNEANIELDNYLIYLKNTNIHYKSIFDISTTGIFDAKVQTFAGKTNINALSLDFNGAKLLEIQNLKDQNVTMRIKDDATRIAIPLLEVTLQFKPNGHLFSFPNLSKLASFSPFMQENNLHQGSVVVQSKDFEKFDATIEMQDVATPLLINNTPLKDFKIALSTDTKTLDAKTLDNNVLLHFDKDITLKIKDINISLPKSEDSFEPSSKITILGSNSSFIDLDSHKTILSESYILDIYKDTMKLKSTYEQSTFEYTKTKKSLFISGTTLNTHFINSLLAKHYFNGGDFAFTLKGTDDKHLDGTFTLHQTSIRDLKFFDNLMATLNAIPSLVVFSDPKFNQGGYFVKDGVIKFTQKGELITILDMQLIGNNADITGIGTIDFSTNQIKLKLKVKTLKTFSSIIDWIPIVGGIILGEDKRISTNIDVTGEINDPKIGTNLIMDTIKSPFNIIKRTLELPFEILTQ